MKIIAIIQARMGSTRLPGKVMASINGKPAIYWIMQRLRQSSMLQEIILATSDNLKDDVLVSYAKAQGWRVYRGSEHDVLSRFVGIIEKEQPDVVARVNADNFAIDAHVIDLAISKLITIGCDVVSPFIAATYPFGSGAEVSTAQTLLRIIHELQSVPDTAHYREHIYFYAYDNPEKYQVRKLDAPPELCATHINISVDTQDQLEQMRGMYSHFNDCEETFTCKDIIKYFDRVANERRKMVL